MVAITPAIALQNKSIVEFQCDNNVVTIYKAFGGATVEFKDIRDVYVSWYPMEAEIFRVNSMNDLYYHDEKYIGWQ